MPEYSDTFDWVAAIPKLKTDVETGPNLLPFYLSRLDISVIATLLNKNQPERSLYTDNTCFQIWMAAVQIWNIAPESLSAAMHVCHSMAHMHCRWKTFWCNIGLWLGQLLRRWPRCLIWWYIASWIYSGKVKVTWRGLDRGASDSRENKLEESTGKKHQIS